jgi:glycosyltransferase involved in cell wall biosynthesis
MVRHKVAEEPSPVREKPQTFSIFFPMYNERGNIEAVLEQARQVIPSLGFERFEIIVVDDGSHDGSADLVDDWIARNGMEGQVRVVRHGQNQGYGRALKTGFEAAVGDVVFYTDSDLPVDLRDLERALPLLEEADVVIGYRPDRKDSLKRKIFSLVYNRLVRVSLGLSVRDVNFSFKLVRRATLDRIRLSARGGFIDAELLAEAHRHGARIVELPVEYTPRVHGSSSFDSPLVAFHEFCELVAYKAKRLVAR